MASFSIRDFTHWAAWGYLLFIWKHKYYLPTGVNLVIFCNSTGAIVKIVFNGVRRESLYVDWTLLIFFVVSHMSGFHMYLRCCSCFELYYCLYYQGEMRWMFVSNYLQMIYEQLKKIEHVYWVLEWIFLIDYIWNNDQFPCPCWQWLI